MLESMTNGDNGDSLVYTNTNDRVIESVNLKKANNNTTNTLVTNSYDCFKRLKEVTCYDKGVEIHKTNIKYNSNDNVAEIINNVYNEECKNEYVYENNLKLITEKYSDLNLNEANENITESDMATLDKDKRCTLLSISKGVGAVFFENASDTDLKLNGKNLGRIRISTADIINEGNSKAGINGVKVLSYNCAINELSYFTFKPSTFTTFSLCSLNTTDEKIKIKLRVENNTLKVYKDDNLFYNSGYTLEEKINRLGFSIIRQNGKNYLYCILNGLSFTINLAVESDKDDYVSSFSDDLQTSESYSYYLYNLVLKNIEDYINPTFDDLRLEEDVLSLDDYLNKYYENHLADELKEEEETDGTKALKVNILNKYNLKNLQGYQIYPLKKSLYSLDGNKPLYADRRINDKYIRNRMFTFKKEANNSMYIADGAVLGYIIDSITKGSIYMDVLFNTTRMDIDDNKRVIFHIQSHVDVILYKNSLNKLILKIDSDLYDTNIIPNLNEIINIGLSWEYSEATDTTLFKLKVNEGTFEVEMDNYLEDKVLLFIGGIKTNNNFLNPLYGYVNNLVITNIALDYDDFNTLKDNIRCLQVIKKSNAFDMLVSKEVINKNINIKNEYIYKTLNNEIMNKVITEKILINNVLVKRFDYEYISKNITKRIIDSNRNYLYSYNSLGYLESETDSYKNISKTYEYDSLGNIITRKTTNNDGTITRDHLYYEDTTNPYLLTKYNDKKIVYDVNNKLYPKYYGSIDDDGNLISGLEFGFDMNRLTSLKDNVSKLNITYKYDYNGYRIRKDIYDELTCNTITHTYYYNNGKLVKEKIYHDGSSKTKYIYYKYDEANLLIGLEYEGNMWYYLRDVTGEITALVSLAGEVVCHYEYDAYGNHVVLDSNNTIVTSESFIGNINPFRYKGYYFDSETSLYYCLSRYYNPEWCRWISPDNLRYLSFDYVEGLNLYCYCLNNPINYVDSSGCFSLGSLYVFLFTSIGGHITQFVVSTLGYTVMAAWAIGDLILNEGDGAWADMCSINWNPFNTDENKVIGSKYISFYKGVPVFLISGNGGSMSLGAIFFDKSQNAEVLKHERGHNTQLMAMGLGNYLIQIGIPSVWKNGDDTPWELSASILGGSAKADNYSETQKKLANNYYQRARIPFINIYNIFQYIYY